ncbi:MAG: hypothetical protein VZR64_04160 [Eubacterium sp.]|nr:hypothetical protein [Eubacterium sp.]
MMHFIAKEPVDICIGSDAMNYQPGVPRVEWFYDNQPFGYDGVEKLFERLDIALSQNENI